MENVLKKHTFSIKKLLTFSNFNTRFLKRKYFSIKIRYKERTMAERIQVSLPPELTPLIDEIREVRAANIEPTTNMAIVIDAVKEYHRKRVSGK